MPRYYLLLSFLWLIGITLYYSFSKKKNLKIFPISVAFIILASNFGFWGADSVSESSQTKRLISILENNNIIVNGKINIDAKINDSTVNSALSTFIYLKHFHSMQPLAEYLEKTDIKNKTNLLDSLKKEYDFFRFLGMKYIKLSNRHNNYSPSSYIANYGDKRFFIDAPIKTTGYDYAQSFSIFSYSSDKVAIDKDTIFLALVPTQLKIRAIYSGDTVYQELQGFALNKQIDEDTIREARHLDFEFSKLSIRCAFKNIALDSPAIENAYGIALVKYKK